MVPSGFDPHRERSVLWQEGEAGLSPQQRLQALQIAGVEVLVTETLAIIALTKTELQQAGHFICQLMGLGTRWPSLVPRLVPSIHLLAGTKSHLLSCLTPNISI